MEGPENQLGLVLEEAKKLIRGDRRADYGDPVDSFRRIAQAWSLVFETDITPEQVALAMVLFKVCREVGSHKRDNLVDICGYADLTNYIIENK